MRLLLDTHALIWWTTADAKLSPRARVAIGDQANVVLVSAVSAVEIALKHRLGKLPQAAVLATQFEAELAAEGFAELPLTARHGQFAGGLDITHKDPFDRMLIAQSLLDGVALVSNEAGFDRFGVSRIW